MKKPLVINCIDGLTGEVMTTIDVDIVGRQAMYSIIEYQIEKCIECNGHDMQLRVGYRP